MRPELDINVPFDLELHHTLLMRLKQICEVREWQLEDAIRILAGHALGIYEEDGYDRDEIEAIINTSAD